MWPHIVLGFIWLEAVFWNPSVASLYKWISTFCENILYFSELLNWEKWEWAETENPQLRNEHSQMIDGSEFSNRFISLKSIWSFCLLKVSCDFCTSLRHCAGVGSVCCIYEWQKVSKLAVLPCGLEGGGLQKSLDYQRLLIKSLEMLETVFDSPCEVPVAQLNCVKFCIQHLWV